MATTYGGEHDPGLIEDVVARSDPSLGFDVRRQSVRRQAIGALDQRYLYARDAYKREHRKLQPSDLVRIKTGPYPYTRVPPLQSIYGNNHNLTSFIDPGLETARHKAKLGWNYLKKLGALSLAWLAVTASHVKAMKLPGL